MRNLSLSIALVTLSACGGEPPADAPDPCDLCDANATCVGRGDDARCVCDWAYEGDGETCTFWVDVARRACAEAEAEHPGYTNIARDVALCGGNYPRDEIGAACHVGWHVCRESEWLERYPTERPYKTSPSDPDLIGPTLGTHTSWGAPQSERCGGGVWLADFPVSLTVYEDSVCHLADDVGDNAAGADYLPWNVGKFLLADDGVTVLQGVNALGQRDCCSWDVGFEETPENGAFAVYCCRD